MYALGPVCVALAAAALRPAISLPNTSPLPLSLQERGPRAPFASRARQTRPQACLRAPQNTGLAERREARREIRFR